MRHLTDDPPPADVYGPAEAAIVAYAQKATRMERIDDATYGALALHFSPAQIIDITMTVGLSNMVNRFHATFLTDLDEATTRAADAGDAAVGSCPIRRPPRPGGLPD